VGTHRSEIDKQTAEDDTITNMQTQKLLLLLLLHWRKYTLGPKKKYLTHSNRTHPSITYSHMSRIIQPSTRTSNKYHSVVIIIIKST